MQALSHSPLKKWCVWAATLLSPLLLLTRAFASSETTLAFDPPLVQIMVGGTAEVDLALASTSAVQGADVAFSFDPAILAVVDADGGAAGVQVAPGTCPAPDFVVLNAVDNPAGTGRYAAVEFITNCSSGDVFSVTFTCLAAGSSPVTVTESTLSDPNGVDIPHSTFAGVVSCAAPTATSTATATATPIPPSATATATPTGTLPPTATNTATATTTPIPPSATATTTPTGTLPATATSTATATTTPIPPSATATPTGTLPATATSTATATATPIPPSATATATPEEGYEIFVPITFHGAETERARERGILGK